jgi:hypothetical protein
VVEEEGIRDVQLACEQFGKQLPQGLLLDFDWTAAMADRSWKRMTPSARKEMFSTLCKSCIREGMVNRSAGVVTMLGRSERAQKELRDRCAVIRCRPAFAKSKVQVADGALVLPMSLPLDWHNDWGDLIDSALALRTQDELAMRKVMESFAKLDPVVPVYLDWAFMEDPLVSRQVPFFFRFLT